MDINMYYLGISKIKGIGAARLKTLMAYFGDPKTAWAASPREWAEALGGYKNICQEFQRQKNNLDIFQYHHSVLEKGIFYLTWDDQLYPELLQEIHDAPPVLFYKGNIKKSILNIAIVGSRKCTYYGRDVAKYLGGQLAKMGINVVSGMARGIDSFAHIGALAQGGYTTAVLGSGIDIIYPPENKSLYNKIAENGLIISEYHPGTIADAANFPARNRLISGMAHGVIVVEAAEKSGSLITVDFALEQGREVFAVPGNITNKNSKGTNNLIKQGAKIVTDLDAILEEFNLYRQQKSRNEPVLTERESLVLDSLPDEPVLLENLCEMLSFSAEELNSLLTLLEIKGLIIQLPGKKIIKNSLKS